MTLNAIIPIAVALALAAVAPAMAATPAGKPATIALNNKLSSKRGPVVPKPAAARAASAPVLSQASATRVALSSMNYFKAHYNATSTDGTRITGVAPVCTDVQPAHTDGQPTRYVICALWFGLADQLGSVSRCDWRAIVRLKRGRLGIAVTKDGACTP